MKITLEKSVSKKYPLRIDLSDDSGKAVSSRNSSKKASEAANNLFDMLEEARKNRRLTFPLSLELQQYALKKGTYSNSEILYLTRFVRLYEAAYSDKH